MISQFAAMALGLAFTRPALTGLFDRALIGRAVRLGAPLALSTLLVFVLNAGDRLIIQRLLGPEEVGRYQVAYVVGYVVVLLVVVRRPGLDPADRADPTTRRRGGG